MVTNNIILPPDMLEAIESCDQQFEEHLIKFESKLGAQPAPANVYHYTNSVGLLGILESGKIRLTDIFGLNDTSEFRHGVNHACEILVAKVQQSLLVAKFFTDLFSRVMHRYLEASPPMFVACFSCDKDDLGQWRAYGDDGRGFVLGFDGGLINRAFIKPDEDECTSTHSAFPITYDDALLCKMHEQLIGEVLPLIKMSANRKLNNAKIEKFLRVLCSNLIIAVIRVAVFFKHEAYKNEKEYRLMQILSMDRDYLKHPAPGYPLVRFTEFDWKTGNQHILREVVIGPAANEKDARSFVHNCLLAGGFDPKKVIVRQSRIPYRSK